MYATIKTTTRTKKTPFNAWNKINRVETTFEDMPKIKRDGKEITLQEYLNSNNQDCTIYDVLNTYGGDKKLTAEAMNKLTHTVADELMEINNLPTALQVMKEAEKAWRELPLDIRKEFGNDVSNFQANGAKWANNKIAEYNKKIEELEKLKTNEPKGEVNNG